MYMTWSGLDTKPCFTPSIDFIKVMSLQAPRVLITAAEAHVVSLKTRSCLVMQVSCADHCDWHQARCQGNEPEGDRRQGYAAVREKRFLCGCVPGVQAPRSP